MRQSVTTRRIARALERSRARAACVPTRVNRKRSRGQTLIIFALLFTALLGFMGLAIDTARVYDQYARMQRAAESGALAGVIYMPNNYLTNITIAPDDNAVCRALRETAKNGFGSGCNPAAQPAGLSGLCPTTVSSVEIAVCPVGGFPHDLKVYITESFSVAFLSALGIGPLNLTVSAQAEYLPPVDVAIDPTSSGGTSGWGTFGECSGASSACLGSGTRNWAGNINGPGELKEQGDPLVTCEEGPAGLNPANANGTIDLNAANYSAGNPATYYTTFVGMHTNHPQYVNYSSTGPFSVPGACQGSGNNGDASSAFTGPSWYNDVTSAYGPQHAGYAFYINIPSVAQGGSDENLWVWNAPFSPSTTSSCNGRSGGNSQASYDVFYFYDCAGGSSKPYQTYPGTSCAITALAPNNSPYTCTDPSLYFSVTYTVYQITGPNNPGGSLLGSFTAMPYEVNDHGCNYWQPTSLNLPYIGRSLGCVSSSNCVVKWCPVGPHTGDATLAAPIKLAAGGQFRVMVVASDYGTPSNFNTGFGGHAYSLKICPTGTTQGNASTCPPVAGATLSGWTMSDLLFSFPGGGGGNAQVTEYPLGFVGPEFAGRTLDIQFFDEGDLSGTNTSATGDTVYAVAPFIAGLKDPCVFKSTDLTKAGYSSSNFLYPYNQRTSANAFNGNPLVGLNGSHNGDLIYNGLWTDEQIGVPSSYTGGNWTVCAVAPQTNDGDVIGIKVEALGESPVHLV